MPPKRPWRRSKGPKRMPLGTSKKKSRILSLHRLSWPDFLYLYIRNPLAERLASARGLIFDRAYRQDSFYFPLPRTASFSKRGTGPLGFGPVDCLAHQLVQRRQRSQFAGHSGMGKNPHSLHIVVELLLGQRANHRRNLLQRTITTLLDEVYIHVKLHLALLWGSIEQNLMRRNDTTQPRAGQRGNSPAHFASQA